MKGNGSTEAAIYGCASRLLVDGFDSRFLRVGGGVVADVGIRGTAMEGIMNRDGCVNSKELAQEMLAAMASEGVTLSDDLGQCELAILDWVRAKGADMLEAHLGEKNSVTREHAGHAGARGFKSL